MSNIIQDANPCIDNAYNSRFDVGDAAENNVDVDVSDDGESTDAEDYFSARSDIESDCSFGDAEYRGGVTVPLHKSEDIHISTSISNNSGHEVRAPVVC